MSYNSSLGGGSIDPNTGLPYQFGNGSGGGKYDPTKAGGDWTMNGDAYGAGSGDSGNGAGQIDMLHNATAMGVLAPTFQGLGYTGNIIDKGTGGDSGSSDSVDPALIDWMTQNGYNIGAAPDNSDQSGGTQFYDLFKGNQALADPTKAKGDDNDFGYALMAAAAAATAGAAAYGGAAGGAGDVGLSGMDLAADGGANSIANPAWTGAGGAGSGGVSGMDLASDGSYPSLGGSSNLGGLDQPLNTPMDTATGGSTPGAGNLAKTALQSVGKIFGVGGDATGAGGMGGGSAGFNPGDVFRQQLTSQALRDPQQAPNQAPGWVPATPGGR